MGAVAPLQEHIANKSNKSASASSSAEDSEALGEDKLSELPNTQRKPAPQQTNSVIRRDAELYGIKYRAPKQFTFWTPQQVKEKHTRWLKILGRVGWGAKAAIYAIIGGLACKEAILTNTADSASPQGAFVLIGTANGGRGALVVLAICTATYSAWRFWEGIVGQGYDASFSKMKNFFKFRLSPFVSGGVYIAYDVLIITTIPRDDDEQRESLKNSTWPSNWRGSTIGKIFLVIVGLAFIAATIVQLEQFLTKSFHNTIKSKFHYMPQKYWKAFRIFVLTTGHLGVLGRAGIFAFASVLFFRTLKTDTAKGKSVFGDALDQVVGSKAGQAALFIMGFLVIVYGLFATLNMYARYFPTPPPTGVRKVSGVNPDDVLPQYAPGADGFHPMTGSQRNQNAPTNPGGGILTPMHNAIAAHPPPPIDGESTSSRAHINTAPPSDAPNGVTVRRIEDV